MCQTEDKWQIMTNRRLRDQIESIRKELWFRSKSQTECKQDRTNYLLIIHSL